MSRMEPRHLCLDLVRGWRGIRVGLFERVEGSWASRGFELSPVDFAEVERISDDLRYLLDRANLVGEMGASAVDEIARLALLLFDEVMPPSVKPVLRRGEGFLTLRVDESLQQLPWEMMHTGEGFLARRFAIGREVMTQGIHAPPPVRRLSGRRRALIVADPRDDLPISAREGWMLREMFAPRPDVSMSYKAAPTSRAYLRENLRECDVLHFAGHAEWEEGGCGWLLGDGRFEPEDVRRLTGGRAMPALIFANACSSASTGRPSGGDEMAASLMAAGARNVIGTLWDIPDSIGLLFAEAFYRRLLEGEPIGEAVRAARCELAERYGEGTVLWGSYVVYGPPSVCYFEAEPSAPEASRDERPRASLSVRDLEAWLQPSPITPNPALRGAAEGRIAGAVSDFQRVVVQSLLGCVAVLCVLGLLVYLSSPVEPDAVQGDSAATAQHALTPVPSPVREPGYQGVVVEPGEVEASMEGYLGVGVLVPDASGRSREVRLEPGDSLPRGARLQLRFHANQDGHAYLLHGRADGTVLQLFPRSEGESSRVRAGQEVSVRYWLDGAPGEGYLVLGVSPAALPEVVDLPRSLREEFGGDVSAEGIARWARAKVSSAEIFRLRGL